MKSNKYKKYLVIFVIFSMYHCLFSSFMAPHAFYVSVSELKYNSKSKQLSISCRVFANDMEACLKKQSKQNIDLLSAKDKQKVDEFLQTYFKKNFVVSVTNKNLNLIYVGFEQEEEAIWVYFKCEKVSGFKQISIDNKILYDQLPEQNNIIHFYYDDNRKSNKLANPESKHVFSF